MNIIFFDGVCGLCNHFVSFMLFFDRKGNFFFSPLQGKTIEKTKALPYKESGSLVFLQGSKVLIKSTAVLRAVSSLGFYWKWVAVFLLIPRFMRDWVYDCIASHRYRWFGRKETCRIPSAKEQSHFLE